MSEWHSKVTKPPKVPWKTGYYYSSQVSSMTTHNPDNNNMYASAVVIPNSVIVSSMNIEVTVAASSGVVRMGIYADNGGVPGTLILDAGTVANTTTGAKAKVVSQPLSPGVYWVALVTQGTPGTKATYRGIFTTIDGFPQPLTATYVRSCFSDYTGVAGALPATFTVSGHDTGEIGFIQLGV